MGDSSKKSAAARTLSALKGIPDDLKYIFVPKGPEELLQFEINVVNFMRRAEDRNLVMILQKKYGLPLRPNMTMRRVMIFVRLMEIKMGKMGKRGFNPPGTA